MIRIICLLIGYCFGLFQTSYIYGRLHGIDIRNYGSGNAGTTNALRTLVPRRESSHFSATVLNVYLQCSWCIYCSGRRIRT